MNTTEQSQTPAKSLTFVCDFGEGLVCTIIIERDALGRVGTQKPHWARMPRDEEKVQLIERYKIWQRDSLRQASNEWQVSFVAGGPGFVHFYEPGKAPVQLTPMQVAVVQLFFGKGGQ